MSASLSLTFLDSDFLYRRIDIKGVVNTFVALGFVVPNIDFNGIEISFDDYERMGEEQRKSYDEIHQFQFKAYNNRVQFETLTQVGWGKEAFDKDERTWFRVSTDNTPYFWHKEFDPEKYSSFFVTLATNLYALLLPRFGWIDFDYGSYTNFEDIENFRLPALYWATYLGPSYVRSIDQSKIINAPAWKVIPLIDGGYLYMTSPTPGLADIHVNTEEVKKYFGVEHVR